MGELSEQNRALIESALDGFSRAMWDANKHISTGDLNRLLDAARTEGRGEGEPVAWRLDEDEIAAALQDSLGPDWTCRDGARAVSQLLAGAAWHPAAEPFFRLAREVITPANGERPWHADSKDWMVVFSFAGQSLTLGDLRRAAVASPIREPEISREAVKQLVRKAIEDAQDSAIPEPWEVAEHHAGIAADAILNLAPVGGRGEEGSSGSDLSPASRSQDQRSDGRSATDYAIEHGGYLADAVTAFLKVIGEESVFGEMSDNGLRETVSDHLQAMRSGVYEFEKRVTRAKALSGAQRSELSRSAPDEPSSSNLNEESQTNGS